MKYFTTALTILASVSSFLNVAVAAPLIVSPLPARDVWDPRVEVPNESTVWKVGHTYEVVW